MILGDFLKALGQLSDGRFLGVLTRGVLLSLGLLVAIYLGFMQLVGWFVPETLTLPWIGEITWVDNLASWASLLLMILLSFFLMVPVASAFSGFFLDDVADAVEAEHYPDLSPGPSVPFAESVRDGLTFSLIVITVNAVVFVVYFFAGPLGPVLFWAVNGYLLGREYFQMVAIRRLGRDGASAMRKRYMGRIWIAGALMAVPLSVPLVNLLVPVLGAATFTHLYHRLARTERIRPA